MIVLFKDTIKLTEDGLELFITPKEIVQNESYENDLELFNMIRNIRKEAAEKFNQPATMICPDEILLKISKAKPKTYTELMNIDGFTQRMFNKIGEAILNEIKNKTSNPFEDETSKLIIDLIRKKYSFEDILSLTKLPESILASRIESIISFARELNFNYLIQPKEMKVIKAKYDAGFLDLRELFNELGKKISYNKLKVAVKILQTN
jgi:ATP-dependent DNA helicase RecQ